MAQITYANKVALNENPEIAAINKVSDNDMNEIKQVVNDNYNNTIQITDTEPTDSDNKIWIDTGEVSSAASEITNEYSTSTGLGYSANYVNNLHTYSETEQRVGTWIDGKPLYRKLIVSTVGTISSSGTIVNNEISTPTNSDLTTLRIKEAYVLNAGRLIPAIMYLNDTLNYFIKVYPLNTNKIRISANNSSYSENTVYILVEYTKTTD